MLFLSVTDATIVSQATDGIILVVSTNEVKKFRSWIMDKLVTKNVSELFAKGVNARIKSGRDLISLGLGQPNYNVPEALVNGTINALK